MREFVRTEDRRRFVGRQLLGSGGQGEVWLADVDDRQVAVKIYHPHTATPEQRAIIERLVETGAPAKYFLWPVAVVEAPDTHSFGYVMELREKRFRPLEDFMARRIETSFRALLRAAWQLADGFLRLHSLGLCYRDISFANIFFDPVVGDVRICDNDNVDVSGTEAGGVLGTQRFMAPEVVRREAKPSDQTDRYSLAVLLFYMLMGGHPLDGALEAKIRCLDLPALERLYGFQPLYIFDPKDASNRPVPGIHDNPIVLHPLYPAQIRDLFLRAFTEGLHYPTKRVRESEWRKAFARALDGILPCAACGSESFLDVRDRSSTQPGACWSCKRPLDLPPRIRLGDHCVILSRDARLYGYHVGAGDDDDLPVADVSQNPRDPRRLGLRNLTSVAWTLTRPDGSIVDVPPGRSAAIVSGYAINFGGVTGRVET
ncbi:MAG: protein kinase [Myxococcales bacterium]|nr:protein kinase [Myxococcales bacterium]